VDNTLPNYEDVPIGTWFWLEAMNNTFALWQKCEDGPHEAGILYSKPTAQYICEKLNNG
jgi:hypothetical protein